MKIEYAEALKKGLKFCIQPKRWLPFFIIDLAFLSIAISLVLENLSSFMNLPLGVQDLSLIGPAIIFFVTKAVILFVVWFLGTLWITGALIHQSHRGGEFNKSWKVSGKRFLSLLGVSIVMIPLAFSVSIIPYIGWIFSIIVVLIFFFVLQSIILNGNVCFLSIQDSWEIFQKQPFKVFLMWLIISGISLLIVLIFALPIIAMLFSIFTDIAGGGMITTATLMNIVFAINNQLVLLVLTGIIFILGLGIARAFSIKSQTEFYEQIKKKHTGK